MNNIQRQHIIIESHFPFITAIPVFLLAHCWSDPVLSSDGQQFIVSWAAYPSPSLGSVSAEIEGKVLGLEDTFC